LKTGILTQELEDEINKYIIDLEFIESMQLRLRSQGEETDNFWETILFHYLNSFSVNLSFPIDLKTLMLTLPYRDLKNLTINVLPISNYIEYMGELNEMHLERFGINITENPKNCVLKAVSKMRIDSLMLYSNNYLDNDEYEFLFETLSNSQIFEFIFFYQERLLNCYPSLQEIAKMNKIKCQIQTQFQYLKRIPGNMNFHFGIERNFSLEEKPAKKMKFK
jgi:hypothetical protein